MFSDIDLKKYYKLYIDDFDETLMLVFFGKTMSNEDNRRMMSLVLEDVRVVLASNLDKHYNMLIDLVLMLDDRPILDKDTLQESSRIVDSPRLRKVAFVGSSSFLKGVVNTLAALSGKGEIQWFTDVKEAKDWFKE